MESIANVLSLNKRNYELFNKSFFKQVFTDMLLIESFTNNFQSTTINSSLFCFWAQNSRHCIFFIENKIARCF